MLPFEKMHLKMLSGKWRPFYLGLNELKHFFFYLPDETATQAPFYNVILPGASNRDNTVYSFTKQVSMTYLYFNMFKQSIIQTMIMMVPFVTYIIDPYSGNNINVWHTETCQR